MNTTNHTPGPWYFTDKAIIGNNGGTFIAENPAVKWEALAALTKNQGSSEIQENIKQAKANAILISLAPELLSALQECVDLLDVVWQRHDDPFGIHHNNATDAEAKARAAIAKARGEV